MIEYSQFIKEEIELIALSDYLGLGDKLDEEGIFDTILDIDANYFIKTQKKKISKILMEGFNSFLEIYIKYCLVPLIKIADYIDKQLDCLISLKLIILD